MRALVDSTRSRFIVTSLLSISPQAGAASSSADKENIHDRHPAFSELARRSSRLLPRVWSIFPAPRAANLANRRASPPRYDTSEENFQPKVPALLEIPSACSGAYARSRVRKCPAR
jgi:hypothetical protein